ncbi:cadmium-translocating P-type ATPase [Metallumcola ferriviriculae]|uniref:Cadmium-translocating P-type ATPase n=1 Tax=Metallumcola ferriviriculae TaxID=3039180 RepID=A0AAU0UND8_9FIRM|nr:cadmium-translocating P-type ATPase [Desulfitibacteraceae bacterium MK1]
MSETKALQSSLVKYTLAGLDCASCAQKIEDSLRNKGMKDAAVNFAAGTILLDPKKLNEAQNIIDGIEPGVILTEDGANQDTAGKDESIKKPVLIMAISLFLLTVGLIFNERLYNTPYHVGEYIVLLSAYFLVGWNVVSTAVRNVFRGNLFDENFLMTVATVGAIAIHQLPEAVGVMLFYYVGEFFQDVAVNRSRRSIKALMDIRPEYANLKTNGDLEKVSPDTVNVGDIIVIKPGEKVPLDGTVEEGTSFLDTSALTGESVPRKAELGEGVLAGMINTGSLLTVRVTKVFEDSSVAKILDLMENAGSRKAPTEKFITKFSQYYTPVVVFGALALAVIPPLVITGATFSEWLYRALILLVISCPCALVVSIPLGYFGGIGGSSKKGILIKGANFLEAMTKLDTVVFDKTGTLTKGVFQVAEIKTYDGCADDELLRYAAIAEVNSNHPIAKSIIEVYQGDIDRERIRDYQEISGHGIKASYEGKEIIAGNDRLLHRENIKHKDCCDVEGTVVYVAVAGKFLGYITIADEIKEDAVEAVANLKKLGVRKTVMLTGDDQSVAEKVASRIGIDAVYANLLPEDKVSKLEELMEGINHKAKLAFVGDGINDAPVITRADIGVAMGGLGSDAAIEAADVVIMDDAPSKMAAVVSVARNTKKIITQNIVLALGIKGVFVVLGSFGMATMWEAVFADVGVALLAVLNATRALKG